MHTSKLTLLWPWIICFVIISMYIFRYVYIRAGTSYFEVGQPVRKVAVKQEKNNLAPAQTQ